jgi:choline dehydrogenase
MFSRIPVAFSLLFGSKHVYQLYTEPQVEAKKKKKFWPRAKMLGGCKLWRSLVFPTTDSSDADF